MTGPSPLVAAQDGQTMRVGMWGDDALHFSIHTQLYAPLTNQGTIWLGGNDIAAERGVPMYPGALMHLPSYAWNTSINTGYVCFEKAGDKLYRLFF